MRQRREGGSFGTVRSTCYDFLGNPVCETDERGNTTTYAYDKLSRVVSVQNAIGQASTTAYDANGNKVSETDWLGNATQYKYDILDRLVSVTDPTGATVEALTYTDNHLQASSTDALGHATLFAYDGLGRLTASMNAYGHIAKQAYDAAGNIASKTDENSNTTAFAYNHLNQMVSATGADGSMTSYSYDAAGNLLSQTDGRGNAALYEYNCLNLPVLRADPGGISGSSYDERRIERFSYYPDGKLQSKRDKNGVTTSYAYDVYGHVTSENAGGEITSYQYDGAGNLLSVAGASGAIVRAYDALNRVASKTVPVFGTTVFAYDITAGVPAGHVGESTTASGRTVTKVYDKAGRLAQVKDGGSAVSYEYYANGSLKTQTLPCGVTANYTYDSTNNLHTLQNKHGSAILEAYQYAYDFAGNMAAKLDAKGTTTCTYTPANQLATVNEPSGKVTSYTYDAAGNRAGEAVSLGGQLAEETIYNIDERNRLLSTEKAVNAQTVVEQYFYDDAGNVLGRRPESCEDAGGAPASGSSLSMLGWADGEDGLSPAVYSYNSKNQMTEATSGGSTATFTYNAEGLRFSKTVEGATTWYCYEYGQAIKELDSEGGVVYNVYGGNRVSREVGGQKAYYLYNGHGDVTGLVGASGSVIASYCYDAFGNILEQSGNFSNPYRYAGYEYDGESELYYLKARYYDPAIARFMQEDTHWNTHNSIYGDNPIYMGGNPMPNNNAMMQSLNLYTYCINNPIRYYDPTGHILSDADKKNLTPTQQAAIEKLTKDWEKAKKEGNADAMKKANEDANAIRASAGYTGGTDGKTIAPTSPGSGVKVKDVVTNASNTWKAGSTPGTSTIGVLNEGIDYYIYNNTSYFFNNVRTIMESAGATVKYDEKKNTINIIPPPNGVTTSSALVNSVLYSNKPLVGGENFYIGWDGKAHFVDSSFGPAPIVPNPNAIKSKLSRDYFEESDVDTWLTFAAGTNSNIDPVLAMRLAAYARDNATTITITSGYRSTARQKEIQLERSTIDEQGNLVLPSARDVAPPGSSWHEFGQAVDTSSNSLLANASEAELNKYGLTKVPGGGSSHAGHIQSYESIDYSQDKQPYYDAYNK